MRKVIVVGGGSSGMMAAIQAAKMGADVTLLEKNPILGRKLLLTGGGRCNVTNSARGEDFIKHIPGNGSFLYSSLSQFDQDDIVEFFNQAGVQLKEEDHGRVFPTTDQAQTILEALVDQLKEYKVKVLTRRIVDDLIVEDKKVTGLRLNNGQTLQADSVILATGGLTYPGTGSTGDGHKISRKLGHTISDIYPTEVAMRSNDDFIKDKSVQGLALYDVVLSVLGPADSKKPIVSHRLDFMFTHFGYSGPAMLRSSGHAILYMKETKSKQCYLSLNMVPDLSWEDFDRFFEENRGRNLVNVLKKWIPERMGELVVKRSGLNSSLAYKHISPQESKKLYDELTDFKISVYEPLPIAKATITGGGVSVKEVEPKSMQSKIIDGLYLCGELLDVNGYTGGYNMTIAFVTGAVAGWHAAWGL